MGNFRSNEEARQIGMQRLCRHILEQAQGAHREQRMQQTCRISKSLIDAALKGACIRRITIHQAAQNGMLAIERKAFTRHIGGKIHHIAAFNFNPFGMGAGCYEMFGP